MTSKMQLYSRKMLRRKWARANPCLLHRETLLENALRAYEGHAHPAMAK